jgi:hypothetical protein
MRLQASIGSIGPQKELVEGVAIFLSAFICVYLRLMFLCVVAGENSQSN